MVHIRLICLNTCSPVGRLIREGLGGVNLLEEVCNKGRRAEGVTGFKYFQNTLSLAFAAPMS